MNLYLNMLYITLVVCYGVGVSGFFRNFKKPFSCDICMTFWTVLLYVVISGNFSFLNLAIVCGFSLLAPVFTGILTLIREILLWILSKISRLL